MATSFKKLADTSAFNNLLIVDSLNLAFRYKHAKTRDYAAKFVETVRSLAKSYECKKIVITADFKGSDYRRSIFPEYKGNRKALKDKQTETEKAEFEDFFKDYLKTLDLLEEMGILSLKYEGVEADDLMAYLVSSSYGNKFDHIWLISSDKDIDLLVSDKVSRFSYVTRKEVTLDNWDQHYDCLPEQYISMKVIAGDSGDNVPGVQGIGPKRAAGLLKQYDSALDIYDAIPIDSKYKHIQNLNSFKEQILINYQLMDLPTYCREAIGSDNIKDIKERLL